MSSLPPEIIAEILCRLPVKVLLCCRSVSKPWRALIDGPNFIRLHLHHSLSTSSNLTIILKNSNLYTLGFDSMDQEPPRELEHPLMCYNHGIKLLGSCDGLLCICNVVDDIALWNPSIRKHQVVPFLPIELNRYFGACICSVHVFGFGYDYVNDDYKVVRIAQFEGVERKSFFESEVKVFSLRNKSWKRIGDMPYFIRYPGSHGVCAGGALHWVVRRDLEANVADVIVALDLGVHEFREVVKPDGLGENFGISLGVLRGCLCLLVNYKDERVDMWVMKEYGVKESWTKLFSVLQQQVIGVPRSLKPLAYSKCGNLVLMEQDDDYLFWYDLRRKEVRRVYALGMPFTFEAEICVGSLMPLNMSRRVNGRMPHEDESKIGKKRDDFLSEGFKLVL